MDKLRENAFALALAGAVVVLLGAAWILVWGPWNDMRSTQAEVEQTLTAVERYARADVVPTQDIVDAKEKQRASAGQALENGIRFYDERTRSFDLYFDDAQRQPTPSAFYTDFADRRVELIQGYRQDFEILKDQETGDFPPEVKGLPAEGEFGSPQEVPLRMKQYWMLEAIVRACRDIDCGGLRSVEFPELGQEDTGGRRRRRGREEEEDEEQEPFIVRRIPATVEVELRFAQIKELLGALYADGRVPFVAVPRLEYKKEKASLQEHLDLMRVITEDPESGEPQKSFEVVVPEPTVVATIQLEALDWGGARPLPGEEESP